MIIFFLFSSFFVLARPKHSQFQSRLRSCAACLAARDKVPSTIMFVSNSYNWFCVLLVLIPLFFGDPELIIVTTKSFPLFIYANIFHVGVKKPWYSCSNCFLVHSVWLYCLITLLKTYKTGHGLYNTFTSAFCSSSFAISNGESKHKFGE